MTISTPSAENAAPARTISPEILFGRSEAMHQVRCKLDRAAPTNVPILIVGESGTGKEVVARHVHDRSPWAAGPFVRINCPAIPASLLESELFGYEQGAFTGASFSKAGLVEAASGGTLFFDGIGELELGLQSKLLQLLQDGEFTPIRGQQSKRANVRIICAASRPLQADIDQGTFRRDLFYRINVVTVTLSPLRERALDIPQLTDCFLKTFSAEFNTGIRPLSSAMRQVLACSDWPGNIRQLQNVIKRYVILDSDDAIVAELSSRALGAIRTTPESDPIFLKKLTKRATIELERKMILDALAANQWNRKRAAVALHISYRALLAKMKQSGLPSKSLRQTVADNGAQE
jgi:two-component system, NtrC family, response regulator AtoC